LYEDVGLELRIVRLPVVIQADLAQQQHLG
jgi:hypothetical protein